MRNKQLHFYSKIFLIDMAGALLTAFLLGVVLPNFQKYIGMPKGILIPLAITALVFSIYSLSCHLLLKANWKPFLKAIAVANWVYCVITTVLIGVLFQQLTILGVIYFISEVIIVGALAFIEMSMVKKS